MKASVWNLETSGLGLKQALPALMAAAQMTPNAADTEPAEPSPSETTNENLKDSSENETRNESSSETSPATEVSGKSSPETQASDLAAQPSGDAKKPALREPNRPIRWFPTFSFEWTEPMFLGIRLPKIRCRM
eukprot:Gregarina_sp_Poly_1__5678@NODE_299_length_9812_cov_19_573320_g258_i0_p5_GENE_NODE_299_length_9812_cov_19_573320_g258_i0NODE_299_length_9812_cov_19_573320_g258_i0_p5_ORF_typecomplete_len133_score29_57HNF1_N/PF04814_13/0_02_NODE_299_length_9812_cov_19_573320_g258_i089309328